MKRSHIWGIIIGTIPVATGTNAMRQGGSFLENYLMMFVLLGVIALLVEGVIYLSDETKK